MSLIAHQLVDVLFLLLLLLLFGTIGCIILETGITAKPPHQLPTSANSDLASKNRVSLAKGGKYVKDHKYVIAKHNF